MWRLFQNVQWNSDYDSYEKMQQDLMDPIYVTSYVETERTQQNIPWLEMN